MLYIMMKPASGQCNLRCRYCFYADEAARREIPSYGVMSLETLDNIIDKAYAAGEAACTFVFQGGEPTLRGLSFFEELIRLQRPHRERGLYITNTIQTNGLLIDEVWAAFLARNQFLVGLSLDGPQALNDALRVDAAGGGSYERICRAARMLQQAGAPFNIVTVVTKGLAGRAKEVYRSYLQNGWNYLQFIPCLDPYSEKPGGRPYSLTPEAYGDFLCTLFDEWYQDAARGRIVYIRYFENILGMLLGFPPESCGVCGLCAKEYVIEADGSVYPCDFYMMDDYRLGNINTDSFSRLDANPRQRQFLQRAAEGVEGCISCRWKMLCGGGCVRNRDNGQKIGQNYYCGAFQAFFEYTLPRFEELVCLARRNHGDWKINIEKE